MHIQELRVLLALEPTWTVSINGREFLQFPSSEIQFHNESVRIGRHVRILLQIEWLRSNVVRLQTRHRSTSRREILTFFPGNQLPGVIDLRRRRRLFQSQIKRALAAHFRLREPIQEILHSDKLRGIGGAYPRFVSGNRAAIAVDPEESAPVIDGIMRAAILWSDFIKRRISVIVPAQRKQTIVNRLHDMPGIQSGLDWLQWNGSSIAPLEMDIGQPETHVHEIYPLHVEEEVARVCSLAPEHLQAVPNIASRAVSIRLRGLEVARVAEGGTSYPMGEPLLPVIESIVRDRRFGSRHPLARAYEERWLESNLIRQINDLLPVRGECIYPQVPSFVEGERNIIDLLTVTPGGRLVVVEIKASPDPELPFQAFDYWQAVERHRRSGDFQAKGYFNGMKIQDWPALLVVVAPLLSFHKTFDRLVTALPRELPLVQVGINQTWKREIKILRRQGTLS